VIQAHAPADEHFEAVERFARDHGLEILGRSVARHHVQLRGAVSSIEAAFGVELEHFQHGHHVYQSHRGPVQVPEELKDVVDAVIGLDDAPLARPLVATARPRAAALRSYTPLQLARHYRFPRGATGAGQRIAIVAFGGGYHRSDLDTYFTKILKLPTPPTVSEISVPDEHNPVGPKNDPFPYKRLAGFIDAMNDPSVSMKQIMDDEDCGICLARALATFEVTMDIEIAGAVAPGAAIDVYFANNTLAGWRAALYAAIGMRDETDREPVRTDPNRVEPATVVSFSWGWTEAQSTGNGKQQIDLALQKAAHLGITVCAASGDLGSLGVDPGGNTGYEAAANVSFPASSRSVLACGGTTIRNRDEAAWNNPYWKASPMATGGGVSGFFPRPVWQAGHNVPMHRAIGKAWIADDTLLPTWTGRGVPDVAANADAVSGYALYVGGRRALGGGTSAAAPLWAGLIARLNQRLSEIGGRPITLGFLNALLYRRDVALGLREVHQGENRLAGSAAAVAAFAAAPGWNACTGLGVPDGTRLLAALSRRDPPRRRG
jgi:kumamolisin